MKNTLLLLAAMAAVTMTSCKKNTPTDNPDDPNTPKMISLNSGGAMLSNFAMSRADAITGVRTDISGFKMGEKIGVTAVFSKHLLESDVTSQDPDEPNWVEARHFTNISASALEPKTAEGSSSINEFNWGADNYQYYPQGKSIFLYAYYPYNSGTPNTEPDAVDSVLFVANSATEEDKKPCDSLQVTLVDETITALAKEIKQYDVMVASHARKAELEPFAPISINRSSTTEQTQLVFRHMLSQLQFTIVRAPEVKQGVTFSKLVLTLPKKAMFPIGGDDLLKLCKGASANTFVPEELTTITLSGLELNEIPASDGTAQVLLDVEQGYSPILVFPLSLEQIKAYCTMKLTVDFGVGYGEKEFDLDIKTAFKNPFVQGKVNKINFTVNFVEVGLTSTILPWGADGSDENVTLD